MSNKLLYAPMRVSADGDRYVSDTVKIPETCSGFGVMIPNLDDNSDIYCEVGVGPLGLLHYAWDWPTVQDIRAKKAEKNLTAYYTFQGGTDDLEDLCESPTTTDAITDSRANTLALTGPIKTTVKSPTYGNGYYWTTNDYGIVTHVSGNAFDITTGDFSIHLVVNMAATAAKMVFAAKRADAGGDGAGYEIGIDAGSSYPYITIEDASNVAVTARGAAAIDDGTETALDFTVDRDGNAVVYINGVASGAATAVTTAQKTLTTTKNLSFGCDSATTKANFLTGNIYEFALFDDVRTANEIANDYLGGFVALADIVDGSNLVVCKSAHDPIYCDITDNIQGFKGRCIRIKCATAQTTTPHEIPFYFVASGV